MTHPEDEARAPGSEGIDWNPLSRWAQNRRVFAMPSEPAAPSQAPAHAAAPAPAGSAAPAPATVPGRTHIHLGLAAVDFGTSSSTVTLFDSGTRSDVALAAEQRLALGRGLADLMDKGLGGPPSVDQEWRLAVADLARHVLTDQRWRSPGAPAEEVTAARLVERLRLESASSTSGLADHVAMRLEQAIAPRGEDLCRAADYALYRVIDAALRQPPLSVLRLFRVTLVPGSREDEIPSVVYRGDGGVPGTMLAPAAGSGDDGDLVPYRGLKQRLGLPEANRDGDLSPDRLIGDGLRFLVDKANDYLEAERAAQSFTAGRLQRIVITYPTMAPPIVRETLRRLVEEQGIRRVVDRYDEAVAASMFLLMREFGGSFDPSIEAFAARSRPVGRIGGARPRHWKHTMLIVDIGGGTTDIALLRLDLLDETPVTAQSGSPHWGRSYRLVPRVLGTTGEAQRGGEFVTLLTFRWIKALLADHLLTTRPGDFERELEQLRDQFREGSRYRAGSLVRAVQGVDEGAAALALADINLVVPTRWAAGGLDAGAAAAARHLFDRIWQLADDAKKALSDTGADHQLRRGAVATILAGIREQRRRPEDTGPLLPGEWDGAPPAGGARADGGRPDRDRPDGDGADWAEGFAGLLSYDTFRQLVEPVVRDQVSLAADLAAMLPALDAAADAADSPGLDLDGPSRLDAGPDGAVPAARLDRVVLTGRGSRLPTVREQLVEALGQVARRGQDGGRVEWDPGSLSQEVEFAKHATSIGAAWAESINEATPPEADERQLSAGAVLLTFDVGQLLSFMRGTFLTDAAVEAGQVAGQRLFGTGTPFRLEGGELVLRSSGWLRMPPMVTIRRQRRAGQSVAWAGFTLDDYRQDSGDSYDRDLDVLQRQLYFQVEATPELNLRILLCKAPSPHYVRSGGGEDVSDHTAGWFAPPGPPAGAPAEVPADAQIVVNPGIPGATTGTAYFVAFSRSSIASGTADTFVPAEAAAGQDTGGEARPEPLRGVISAPLPPPGPDGWLFYLRDPAQPEAPMRQIARLAPPDAGAGPHPARRLRERAGTSPLYTAVLDESGRLTVYPGHPPFRMASRLAELDAVPGSVLAAAMPSAQADYHSPDDPFSGLH